MELPYRERLISAQDGLRLYCRDYGDPSSSRTPVLCLTGLTRNSKDFANLALHLAPRRRVLCPDYRGRGRSEYDPNWRNYDPFVYLADIGDILAACGVERVIAVGSSLGGILAMGLAVLRPACLAAAVLNDIGPDVAPDGLGRILDFIRADQPQRDWPSAIRLLRDALPLLASKDDAWWEDFTRATYREGADGLLHFDWDIAIAKPLLRSNGKFQDLWPIFRALRDIPTLAVRGALSDVLSAEGLARMVAAKPDLEHVTVADVGHVPTLDEPEIAGPLDAFIDRF
ncbi:MAG TPA: alpha/beta hydrolase [Stellaceae bacterium]|nr:alpha/beta hydrolase [Stellaceae bacterium]